MEEEVKKLMFRVAAALDAGERSILNPTGSASLHVHAGAKPGNSTDIKIYIIYLWQQRS